MKFTDFLPPIIARNFVQTTNLHQTASSPIRGVAAQEFGTSGTENFGGYIRREDYNPEFDDWQRAVAIYDKMRRSDAQVRAMLQVIKLPLRGATWQCNPASSDPVDKQIADFCNSALFDDDSMEDPWDFTLRHILLQLEFGVSVLEKIWKVDEDGYYRFKRLAPRLARTIREWHVNREGKLEAIVQYAPVPHTARDVLNARPTSNRTRNGLLTAGTAARSPSTPSSFYANTVSYQYLTIPAEYCAVFVLDREGDNYEGYSLLRNVYRNWYFKDEAYRIMGVGLDRWGVGIPIAALEEGHNLSTGDRLLLREILQSVRSNERAYMVTPEHVNFKIEPSSGGGQGTAGQFGIAWIDHNDQQMGRNVLATFLMGRGAGAGNPTTGFGKRLTDMFISSLDGIAAGIAGDIKNHLVKPLCDYNFDMARRHYPDPVCLDLEQTDMSALVDVLAKLQGTIITPQDDDENVLRKMLGMPPLAPTRSREAKTKDAAAPGDASAVPQPGDGTNAGDATNPNRAGPGAPPHPGGGGGFPFHHGPPTAMHPGAPHPAMAPPHQTPSPAQSLSMDLERDYVRDDHGRFSGDGPGVGDLTDGEQALQKRLVDFKEDRNLTGPRSQAITSSVPGSSFSQYVKVPGLDAMHAAMGVKPSLDTNPLEYQGARDALFAKQPERTIAFDKLTFTQPRINRDRAEALTTAPSQLNKPVQLLKNGDTYYVMNGHHRAVASYLAGRAGLVGQVFDVSKHLSRVEVYRSAREAFLLDWDESQHPRDERGRFGEGGGGGASHAGPSKEETHATLVQAQEHPSFTAHPDDYKDTETAYKQDGQWTAARQELHKAIIADQLAGKEKAEGRPTAVMMGGGPASGKSTMLESGHVTLPPERATVHIDPDQMKAQLPEYAAATAAKDERAARFAHEESSHLAKALTKEAAAGGHHVVIDGTGDSSYDNLASKVEKLREAGSDVKAHYATNDVELAVKLAKMRGDATGRYVPEDFIRQTHASVSRVLPEAIKNDLFDEVHLYNTDIRGEARLILSKVRGQKETIHDQKLYDDFVAKGKTGT